MADWGEVQETCAKTLDAADALVQLMGGKVYGDRWIAGRGVYGRRYSSFRIGTVPFWRYKFGGPILVVPVHFAVLLDTLYVRVFRSETRAPCFRR